MSSPTSVHQESSVIHNGEHQFYVTKIKRMETKKINAIGHINLHKIYIINNSAPKGLRLTKTLQTGDASLNCKKDKLLQKTSVELTKIAMLSFENKLKSINPTQTGGGPERPMVLNIVKYLKNGFSIEADT